MCRLSDGSILFAIPASTEVEHRPRGLFRARWRARPDAEAEAPLRPQEVRHADQQLLQCLM